MTEGTFVTIEGLDGAGKTTVADAIEEEFSDVTRTQEPSDLWTGKQVRRAISNDTDDVHPLTTFYLFMADRVYHIDQRIKPAVESGELVVSDRYADSTLAYQPVAVEEYVPNPHGYMRKTMAPWNYEPDVTIFIDIPVHVAIERSAGDEEYEKAEFLSRVKQNYEFIQDEFSDRYVIIDGTQSKEEVREQAVEAIKNA